MKITCQSTDSASTTLLFPARFKKILKNPFWRFFVPEIKFSDGEASVSNCTVELTFSNKFELKIASDKKKVLIKTNFSEKQIRDVIVVNGYILERQRQAKRIYSIHGSLVTKQKSSVAFLGGMSGIGKTTVAQFFKKKGRGAWSFDADEKFLLSGMDERIVGGVKMLNVNQKQDTTPKYIDLKNGITRNAKLKFIVFPILTNEKKITSFRYTKKKLRWHLYEEASRDIRMINALVDEFNSPIASLDTQKIAKKRMADIKRIATRVPAYFLRGNAEKIYAFIDRKVGSRHRG